MFHSDVCIPMTKWYSLMWYTLYQNIFIGSIIWILEMDERKLSSTMQSAELTPFQKLKIKKIEDTIEEASNALANHKIYSAIETIEDLRIFMAHHIYCVWDFMNLIKVGFQSSKWRKMIWPLSASIGQTYFPWSAFGLKTFLVDVLNSLVCTQKAFQFSPFLVRNRSLSQIVNFDPFILDFTTLLIYSMVHILAREVRLARTKISRSPVNGGS